MVRHGLRMGILGRPRQPRSCSPNCAGRLPTPAPGPAARCCPLGVRIQRQVVGKKIDVVRQQQLQALLHPARDPAILATPEQAVVHENGVGRAAMAASISALLAVTPLTTRRSAFLALHLQAIGAVVFETFGLQQPSNACRRSTRDMLMPAIVARARARQANAAPCAAKAWRTIATIPSPEATAELRAPPFLPHLLIMKRFWLLFSQTVTVFVAAYFVVATLQPDWLRAAPPARAPAWP
jgi:hypothetical protein